MQANNPKRIPQGRRVVLALSERQVLKSAFLVYILPVAAFLTTALLANAWLGADNSIDRGALITALAGVAGMAGSFLWLRRHDRRMRRDSRSRPTIIGVVG
ncbi:putative sigma-E factor regulatory protein RseC [Magnetofaba australis IT-1]|uniref:Putative sigma-E factor regulatory protein RseC n=1 Tax=Magnetofaba australis IT-1 TaxID=1434232 RepID=A0A1Y2K465_9PROT|nr:putative sigma-E factor regulatory protein RseC [Magnetofaba australis IT-1]